MYLPILAFIQGCRAASQMKFMWSLKCQLFLTITQVSSGVTSLASVSNLHVNSVQLRLFFFGANLYKCAHASTCAPTFI